MQDLRRLADRPTWLLGRAYARSRTLLNEGFGQEGLSGYHFRVLAALDEHGSLSQADLGRHAKLDRSDVVATVKVLASLLFFPAWHLLLASALVLWLGPGDPPSGLPVHAIYAPRADDLTRRGLAKADAIDDSSRPRSRMAALAEAALTAS